MADFNSGGSQENSYSCPGAAGFDQLLDRSSDLPTGNSEVGCSSASNILSHPRMVHNPFAVRSDTSTKSMADSTDHKESRPILAPATLVLGRANLTFGATNNGSGNSTSSAAALQPAASAMPGMSSAFRTPVDGDSNKFVFRPSAFDSTGGGVSSTFRLKPPTLNNPFLKVDASSGSAKRVEQPVVSTTREEPDKCLPDTGQEMDGTVELTEDGDRELAEGTTPPSEAEPSDGSASIATSSATVVHRPPATSNSCFCPASSLNARVPPPQSGAFVFGQNMDSRVQNFRSMSGVANGSDAVSFENKGPHPGGARAAPDVDSVDTTSDANDDAASKQVKSLTESALEYESRQPKRTYEEVAIVTGEEDESNVLQMNCKLFTFDKPTSSWVEKGRGLLRLNDKKLDDFTIQSRIVARTQGSLRVVLNAKVWSGMSVDRPNPKSVRLTAQDGEAARIFLITGSTKDIDQLFGALDWRVTTLKTAEEKRSAADYFMSAGAPQQHSASGGGATGGPLGGAFGGRDESTISSSAATSPNLSVSPCSSSSSSSSSPPGASGISITVTSGSSSCTTASSLESPGGGGVSGPPTTLMPAAQAENLGPKKRRISPPSEQDEEEVAAAILASVTHRDAGPERLQDTTRVQERRVDSTDNIDSNSCDDSNLSFASSSTV